MIIAAFGEQQKRIGVGMADRRWGFLLAGVAGVKDRCWRGKEVSERSARRRLETSRWVLTWRDAGIEMASCGLASCSRK